MRVKIKPENQIERINKLLNELSSYKNLDSSKLVKRPNEKSWSLIEIMKHISLAHDVYKEKVSEALSQKPEYTQVLSEFGTSAIPSYLIKRFPPKNGEIKMKMKTSKVFRPVLDLDSIKQNDFEAIISELENALNKLKNWVNHYRTKPISLKKFNSAIGPIVRFHAPEACEFILCHNERHFQQIRNTLKRVEY